VLGASLLAVLLIAGCADSDTSGGRTGAGRSPTSPDDPIASPILPPSTPGAPGSATVVRADPAAVDVRPRPFGSAEPAADGRSVVLRWWGGVAPCEVLAGVTVRESATEVALTLRIGNTRKGAEIACIALAQQFETTVVLPAPLGGRRIVDGAA